MPGTVPSTAQNGIWPAAHSWGPFRGLEKRSNNVIIFIYYSTQQVGPCAGGKCWIGKRDVGCRSKYSTTSRNSCRALPKAVVGLLRLPHCPFRRRKGTNKSFIYLFIILHSERTLGRVGRDGLRVVNLDDVRIIPVAGPVIPKMGFTHSS